MQLLPQPPAMERHDVHSSNSDVICMCLNIGWASMEHKAMGPRWKSPGLRCTQWLPQQPAQKEHDGAVQQQRCWDIGWDGGED